ncbi:hypothetical protein SZ64_02820 [Erythrobacter sp. SG61-1L]|uniref:DUF3828 domain-containing protein n=1 Tax=Erythrobacter sp. SG61-1L TaxID=1603897 RepID=UPI0006C93576|nr:DUF3828 domain-containing protein [Erythrobacter sp. SG61-1L]KPL67121.1 hypothetical protein SZ64_02820 [Erythrobacter sp. SG61-1L]
MMKILRGTVLALAAVALPVSPAWADEDDDILAAAQAAFAPYQSEEPWTGPDWDMPIFSSETKALVDEWKAGLSDEDVEDLNSFSWLCQCQDFDPNSFLVELEVNHAEGTDVSTVDARAGFGPDRNDLAESELYMLRENGRWTLDDIVSESFPKGLKVELVAAIAAHKARPAEADEGAE